MQKDLQKAPIFAAPGAVAQSVEQRTENPCVGGSIPPHTTENKRLTLKIVSLFYLAILIISNPTTPRSIHPNHPCKYKLF